MEDKASLSPWRYITLPRAWWDTSFSSQPMVHRDPVWPGAISLVSLGRRWPSSWEDRQTMVTGHWPLVGQGHCQWHKVVYASQTLWSDQVGLGPRIQNTEFKRCQDLRFHRYPKRIVFSNILTQWSHCNSSGCFKTLSVCRKLRIWLRRLGHSAATHKTHKMEWSLLINEQCDIIV